VQRSALANALMGLRSMIADLGPANPARYFTAALDDDPHNAAALGGARAMFVWLGNLDLAIRVGAYQVRREPLDYWALANQAEALLRNDMDAAIDQFRAANTVSPYAEGRAETRRCSARQR
jgi:hypothetical protein